MRSRLPRAGGSDPDFFGGRAAQGDTPGGGGEGERLVVVTGENAQPRARTDTTAVEEFQQLAVALVGAADGVALPHLGFRQRLQPAVYVNETRLKPAVKARFSGVLSK